MRYVKIDNLKDGMVLVNAIYDNRDKILLRETNKINPLAIRKIRELGYAGVYIYDEDEIPVSTTIIPDELRIRAIRHLKKLDVDECLEIAGMIAESLFRMPMKLMETIYLSTAENYTYSHCVNVCLLATITGIGMELTELEVTTLAQAALLHDIGKSVVAPEILDKPGSLTQEEWEEVQKHPEYGYNILKRNDMISSVARVAVYEHHENADGTGYPRGLKGEKIHLYAKIIHIADVYDALTSKRCYKDAMNPADAMEYLMSKAGTMFDATVLQVFLRHVALYPIGCMVKLSNGKKATVVTNNASFLSRPIVKQEDGFILNLMEHPFITITKLYK